MSTNITTLKLIIHGTVQGVFYRASMQEEAKKLSLLGWVKNHNSNQNIVEALIQGPEDKVYQLIKWAHIGPPNAQVKQVNIKTGRAENFTKFEILY